MKQVFSKLKTVLSVGLSVALLAFIFAQVDWPEMRKSFAMVRAGELLSALMLLIAGDVLMAVKSWFLKPEMPLYRVLSASLTAKFFSLLPGANVAGEAVRLLKLREMVGMQSAASMMIIDKQSHMIPAMTLCLIGLLHPSVRIYPAFIVFAVVALCWPLIFPGPLFIPGIRRWLIPHAQKLRRFKWGGAVADQAEMLGDACAELLEKPRKLVFHLGCGFLGELCTVGMMVLLSTALDFPVRPFDYLWLNGFLLMAMVIPISVMGMGVREGAMVYFLGWFGVDVSQAMSMSLIISSLTIVKGLLYAPAATIEARWSAYLRRRQDER